MIKFLKSYHFILYPRLCKKSNKERVSFLSEDIKGGTTKEKEDAFSTCLSYCGKYEVQAEKAQIIHHIKASSFPNWTGRSVVRIFKIKENQLTLTTPPMQINAQNCVGVLTWIKVLLLPTNIK